MLCFWGNAGQHRWQESNLPETYFTTNLFPQEYTIYTLVCSDFTYSILLCLELRLDLRCPAILQGVDLATSLLLAAW